MSQKSKPQFTHLMFESFIKAAENAQGSAIFQSLIVKDNKTGKISDVLKGGEYSCAFFVSGLLTLFNFFEKPCATVTSLEKQLNEKGCREINESKIRPGDIIIWEEMVFKNGTRHRHAGIAVSISDAVSTNHHSKVVERNHLTFGVDKGGQPNRNIEKIFRLPK